MTNYDVPEPNTTKPSWSHPHHAVPVSPLQPHVSRPDHAHLSRYRNLARVYPGGRVGTRAARDGIYFTPDMFNPSPGGADATWAYQRTLRDANFMSAGQIVIPAGGHKPLKYVRDNSFTFFIIEGRVRATVRHNDEDDVEFNLASGGMFIVPRGGAYSIENIATDGATLFFSHARCPTAAELRDPNMTLVNE
ncbi:Mif2/CENP-C like-domain-containing protein [Mycena leptocephala]|nr:Mif2/CENP-C like-domain-containing protein [Mycena leptocephala]